MQQVVDRARIPLNDLDADAYRYSVDDLLMYANFALRKVRRDRPDLYFGTYSTPLTDKVIGDTLPIDDDFAEAVVDYVVARAETKNDEAALRERAKLFFGLFETATGTG